MIYDSRIYVKKLFGFIIFLFFLAVFIKEIAGFYIAPTEVLAEDSKQQGAVLGVDVVTADVDVLDLEIISIEAPDVNRGDTVRLLINIKNKGNTAIALDRVNLEVMDLSGRPLENLTDATFPKIDPSETRQIQAEFNSYLDKGQYSINVSTIFMGEEIFRKKMILIVNSKPVKVKDDESFIDIEKLMQTYVFYRRLGFMLMVLGLLLLVLVLIFFFRREKENNTSFERKLSEKLKMNKLILWAVVGASTLIMAFGFYFFLSSSYFIYK